MQYSLFLSFVVANETLCLYRSRSIGKRKGLPPGFPGLACCHCFGGYGSGRFSPSSINTLSDTSKTLNVLHNHMIRCRKCRTEVGEHLQQQQQLLQQRHNQLQPQQQQRLQQQLLVLLQTVRGMNQLFKSARCRRTSSAAHKNIVRLCDAWLVWSFQANFMFEPILQ